MLFDDPCFPNRQQHDGMAFPSCPNRHPIGNSPQIIGCVFIANQHRTLSDGLFCKGVAQHIMIDANEFHFIDFEYGGLGFRIVRRRECMA